MGLGVHLREADKKNTEDDWPKPISNALSKRGAFCFCARKITGGACCTPVQGYK